MSEAEDAMAKLIDLNEKTKDGWWPLKPFVGMAYEDLHAGTRGRARGYGKDAHASAPVVEDTMIKVVVLIETTEKDGRLFKPFVSMAYGGHSIMERCLGRRSQGGRRDRECSHGNHGK